jgi:hypothetical protein
VVGLPWGRGFGQLCRTVPALILIGLLMPTVAFGSFRGANGVIAYAAEHSIWAVNLGTGDESRLTSGPDDSWPAFSPSGRMLAFQRRAAGRVMIYLAGADGAAARPLVEGSEPAFSPSGLRVVFVRAAGLFITGTAPGSTVRQITDHPGDRDPQWSSTGTIVFERTDSWPEVITCIPASASYEEARRLAERGEHECMANVGHERIEARQTELDLITPPSRRVRQVLAVKGEPNYPARDIWPEWSPTGKTVVVSTCGWLAPDEAGQESEEPRLRYVESCADSNVVWAPAGHPLENSSALPRSQFFSCPAQPEEGSELSWQPRVRGTVQVPTMPCATTRLRSVVVPFTETAPSEEPPPRARRTKSRSHHHHRR